MKLSARLLVATLLVACVTALLIRTPPEPSETRASEPGAGALGQPLPEIAFLRRVAKALIARDVIAGRRPAREAAAIFRELDRLSPTPDEIFPRPTGTTRDTDDEHYCEQVINWVGGELAADPTDNARAVLARLDAEFRAGRDEHGAVRLPHPSSLESAQELIRRVRAGLSPSQRQALFGSKSTGR
jgi:hypothetical protein